jgi:glutamate dehydrogenase
MLHGPLSKMDPHTYSRPNLHATVSNSFYTHFFAEIADLFLARFNPSSPLPNSEFAEKCVDLEDRISALSNEPARIMLQKTMQALKLTRRTNFFMPNRYALSFRVDPSLMVSAEQAQPFGCLFVHGGGFDGFHNRFQNIARGGLRLVSATSAEQYAIESSRCYDEVYGLSYAQQLKNKDIPEGGAKAVVLVDLVDAGPDQRHALLRNSVKGFTDSMLDLIVKTEETQKYMVDHLGFDELIYLGPDEQIIPEDIDWIIQRAAVRGYPIPAAFMSSKPLAGINHKVYGVTSEGVAVFLDVALRNKGINPSEQEFSIKITGGPDGDVAGNLMRILFRDYGDNVKVVGVADGSGCAEDPAGLSHSELMRLFDLALPIGEMDSSTLSSGGSMHLANNEKGIRMRNSMVNRVKADVFVPAGGRPSTIHAGNWQQFLDSETGAPSSPLIVEGANIFLTPEARSGLFETGNVLIVKDSSANKCGVITSSYEICASMLVNESEFLEIKEELVQDVLLRLRELARMEAELLFREYSHYHGALPDVSSRISEAINRAKSAIADSLADMERGDSTYQELIPLFHEHLPRKLCEVAAHRIDERIPLDYLRNAFASCLASKLLYREGTHFLESQPSDRLASIARNYYEKEKHVQHLLSVVDAAVDLPEDEKNQVLTLLKRGGARSALQA